MINLNRLTPKEIQEFFILKDRLFGTDSFVVLDEKDPEVIRYNQLMTKVMCYIVGKTSRRYKGKRT